MLRKLDTPWQHEHYPAVDADQLAFATGLRGARSVFGVDLCLDKHTSKSTEAMGLNIRASEALAAGRALMRLLMCVRVMSAREAAEDGSLHTYGFGYGVSGGQRGQIDACIVHTGTCLAYDHPPVRHQLARPCLPPPFPISSLRIRDCMRGAELILPPVCK